MANRIKLIDIELTQSLAPQENLGDYDAAWATVKWHGRPLGRIWLPLTAGRVAASTIYQALFPEYTYAILRELVANRLLASTYGQLTASQPMLTPPMLNPPTIASWEMADLLKAPVAVPARLPSVTIACCISDRSNLTTILQRLSEQISEQISPPTLPPTSEQSSDYEILIVETLPSDRWVADTIAQQYPQFRYIAVQEAGLNQARNAAITAATGAIIAFCDDRVWPQSNWAQAIARGFAANPQVQVITGFVRPAAIEYALQKQFNDSGHIVDRGTNPIWHRRSHQPDWINLGTMQVGSGLNMACRRTVFDQVGRFDPALDVAGVTAGGGDWDFFCRVILAGETILYHPAAIVEYAMPADDKAVQQRFRQEMTGLYSFIQAGSIRYPELRSSFQQLARWQLGQLIVSWNRPHCLRHWITQSLKGALFSMGNYRRGLEKVAAMPPNPQAVLPVIELKPMLVQPIDVSAPLPNQIDGQGYKAIRLYLNYGDRPIGQVDIANHGGKVSAQQIAWAIADQLPIELLAVATERDRDDQWALIDNTLSDHWRVTEETVAAPTRKTYPPLSLSLPVSVIITTCDRPDDLRRCLQHLTQQSTPRRFEIIVADNRPASGLTPKVVAEFAAVRYVAEPRPGGSYGRNAAFVVSTGDIVVTVDDDVTVPPDWLEKLLAPMNRPEVMVVTGNVLPLELETPAQWMFENLKGGLGEGFKPFEADRSWLDSFDRSPPTWDLGVSANAAFRSTIFHHPQIGMMDEVLGPGTPTVGGEENHLVYKVLRAGYTVVYEPSAYVWHRHRRDLPGFYRQIHGHMKGGTAYHMVLWLQEKDQRGKQQLLVEMPKYLRGYVIDRLLGKHKTPWRLIWSEVSGYVAGFWGYWQSVQRLKVLGRSQPYVPVAQRSGAGQSALSQSALSQSTVSQSTAGQSTTGQSTAGQSTAGQSTTGQSLPTATVISSPETVLVDPSIEASIESPITLTP
jgi:O-antigen biosynthesis protein